jgi:hypothetical protein
MGEPISEGRTKRTSGKAKAGFSILPVSAVTDHSTHSPQLTEAPHLPKTSEGLLVPEVSRLPHLRVLSEVLAGVVSPAEVTVSAASRAGAIAPEASAAAIHPAASPVALAPAASQAVVIQWPAASPVAEAMGEDTAEDTDNHQGRPLLLSDTKKAGRFGPAFFVLFCSGFDPK